MPETALATFLVDPPTMLILGLLLGLFASSKVERVGLPLVFWGFILFLELPAYFDLAGHGILSFMAPLQADNDFMWNGYAKLLGQHVPDGWYDWWASISVAGQSLHLDMPWRFITGRMEFAEPTYRYWWSWPWLLLNCWIQWKFLRYGFNRTRRNKKSASAAH